MQKNYNIYVGYNFVYKFQYHMILPIKRINTEWRGAVLYAVRH